MGWNTPRRPKIQHGNISYPNDREGGDGDIQIRQTNLGAKLFGKVGGIWYSAPLTASAGDPVTRFGVKNSDHLAITKSGIEIHSGGVKVASFGSTVIIGDVGAGKSNVLISGGALNIRNNTTNKMTLSSSGNITLSGTIINSSTVNNFIFTDKPPVGGAWNVVMGNTGLGSANADYGYFNVAVGYAAATDMDADGTTLGAGTAGSKGSYNTCVGYEAGEHITTGNYNTFIGVRATGALTTSNQIAIGKDSSTSGASAIAIGDTVITSVARAIAMGSNIENSTYDTVMFGDSNNSIKSADWDTSGALAWTGTSDVRKKRNIKDSNLGLEFINKFRPVSFQFKRQNEVPEEWQHYSETNNWDIDKIHYGFIAQEVKEILDEFDAPYSIAGWNQDSDGMQRLGETKLITPLIKAVQELSAKIDIMQTEINNLKEG